MNLKQNVKMKKGMMSDQEEPMEDSGGDTITVTPAEDKRIESYSVGDSISLTINGSVSEISNDGSVVITVGGKKVTGTNQAKVSGEGLQRASGAQYLASEE